MNFQVHPDFYSYTPLDTTKQQIRLAKLLRSPPASAAPFEHGTVHCELETFDFATAPKYITLSYTWGDPLHTRMIYIDKRPFIVRTNLFDFLNSFRSEDTNSHHLWIDQLCINQGSTKERNHQVRLMEQIYRSCMFVIMWLDLTSKSAASGFSKKPDSENTVALLRNRYFTRLWIIQEIVLPPKRRILCGNTWVDCLRLLQSAHRFDVYGITFWSWGRYILGPKPIISPLSSLTQNVVQFTSKSCEDPRDKLYGLLGLLEEKDRPDVDYEKSVEEVFLDIVKLLRSIWFPEHARFLNDSSDSKPRAYTEDLAENMGFSATQLSQLQLFLRDVRVCHRKSLKEAGPAKGVTQLPNMGFEKPDAAGKYQGRWWYEHEGKRHYRDGDGLSSVDPLEETLGPISSRVLD